MEGLLSVSPVTPRRICIALAISSTTFGPAAPGAFPLLHALVSDTPLPTLYASPPKSHAFQPLLAYLSAVKISGNPGESEYADTAAFVQDIVSSLESVADLQDVIETYILPIAIDGGLIDGLKVVDPEGPLGVFVREVHATCQAISFEATIRLYENFIAYTKDEIQDSGDSEREFGGNGDLSRAKGHEDLFSSLNRAVGQGGFALSHGCPVESDEDFQLVMDVNRLSKTKDAAINIAVKEMMTASIPKRDSISLPGTEFVKYCESLRRRNFAESIDSIHRYGDLTLAEISSASGQEPPVENDQGSVGRDPYATARAALILGKQHDVKYPAHEMGHQYTSLALARTLFSYGYYSQATAVLNDSVRVAQQNGDEECQALALQLMARTASSSGKRLELFTLAKDQLSAAREHLQSIEGDCKKEGAENYPALEIGSLGTTDDFSLRRSRISRFAGPSSGIITVDSWLVSAAEWVSSASLPTALSLAKTALQMSRRMRPSNYPLRLSSLATEKVQWNGEARAMAAVLELESRLGHRKKCIDELKRALAKLEDRRICPSATKNQVVSTSRPEALILRRCFYLLSFQEASCGGQIQVAKYFCTKLGECASVMRFSEPDAFPDAELEALEVKCCWLLDCDSYSEAMACNDLLKRKASVYERAGKVVESYRLEAEIHLRSGSPKTGLEPALTAVSLGQGLGLKAEFVKSLLMLAAIVLELPESDTIDSGPVAIRMVREVMPVALEGFGLRERGNILLLHGKALKASCHSLEAIEESLTEITESFQDAVTIYETLGYNRGLKDCYCFMARVYNEVGRIVERNRAAEKYRKYANILLEARKVTTS